jgi:hypothetical protein
MSIIRLDVEETLDIWEPTILAACVLAKAMYTPYGHLYKAVKDSIKQSPEWSDFYAKYSELKRVYDVRLIHGYKMCTNKKVLDRVDKVYKIYEEVENLMPRGEDPDMPALLKSVLSRAKLVISAMTGGKDFVSNQCLRCGGHF